MAVYCAFPAGSWLHLHPDSRGFGNRRFAPVGVVLVKGRRDDYRLVTAAFGNRLVGVRESEDLVGLKIPLERERLTAVLDQV